MGGSSLATATDLAGNPTQSAAMGPGRSAAVGGAAGLDGLVQLVVDVQALEEELRRAGDGRLARVAVLQVREELRGHLLGSLLQARDAGDPLQESLRWEHVAQLEGLAGLEILDDR